MTKTAKDTKCQCGCSAATKGGKFLPGHDAKLKSRLVAASAKGDAKATAALKAAGWERFIPTPTEKATATNGKAAKPARKTAAAKK